MKDALLAEYSALRSEIEARMSAQGTTLGWILALVGGFVGALLTLQSASSGSLLASLIHKPAAPDVALFAVLAAGYTIGVDLLITYWLFQSFMVFRISRYIVQLGEQLHDLLDPASPLRLFAWEQPSRPPSDFIPTASPVGRFSMRLAFRLCTYMQPATILGLSLFGAIATLASTLYLYLSSSLPVWFRCSLLAVAIFLAVGWSLLALTFLMLYHGYFMSSLDDPATRTEPNYASEVVRQRN
jgi:hypothetical protein